MLAADLKWHDGRVRRVIREAGRSQPPTRCTSPPASTSKRPDFPQQDASPSDALSSFLHASLARTTQLLLLSLVHSLAFAALVLLTVDIGCFCCCREAAVTVINNGQGEDNIAFQRHSLDLSSQRNGLQDTGYGEGSIPTSPTGLAHS